MNHGIIQKIWAREKISLFLLWFQRDIFLLGLHVAERYDAIS